MKEKKTNEKIDEKSENSHEKQKKRCLKKNNIKFIHHA